MEKKYIKGAAYNLSKKSHDIVDAYLAVCVNDESGVFAYIDGLDAVNIYESENCRGVSADNIRDKATNLILHHMVTGKRIHLMKPNGMTTRIYEINKPELYQDEQYRLSEDFVEKIMDYIAI